MTPPSHTDIAIIGSGFAGIGAAIRLKQEGFADFVVLERASELGGVWRENVYPGCACDIPSHLYSFSFAPNPDWSRAFSPGWEIQQYLKDCAERFGITPQLRFGHEVQNARWDEAARLWRLETSQGDRTARVLIAGSGAFNEPALPQIPGLDSFQGKQMHSARWDPAYPLEGKRVGVVGTGASSIQIVPAIQPKVSRLTVFQRTPPWIMPRGDRPLSPAVRKLFRKLPFARTTLRAAQYAVRELNVLAFENPSVAAMAERYARWHLARSVEDPALRAKLTPRYRFGCKRVLVSDDYLPSLTQPNVELVTEAIREIRPRSVVTADGRAHELDVLILGTGFHVTHPEIARYLFGRGGRSLEESWAGSPKAHLGTTVSGFPNLFLLQGPNTGLGHNSVLVMIESQIELVLSTLRFLEQQRARAIEPRTEAQDAFVAWVDARLRQSVWNVGGCQSWYLDSTGRNSAIWPGFTFSFRRRLSRLQPSDYVLS